MVDLHMTRLGAMAETNPELCISWLHGSRSVRERTVRSGPE
jgi:hypothetical protein